MKQESQQLNLADFRATDREQCGIIVGVVRGRVRVATRIVEVPNVAENPQDDYAILASDLRNVEKSLNKGEAIVGFFHTHCDWHDIRPSANDYAGAALFPDFLNLIYKPSTGEKVWYRALTVEENTET